MVIDILIYFVLAESYRLFTGCLFFKSAVTRRETMFVLVCLRISFVHTAGVFNQGFIRLNK